jgi:putative peptide zinc metalloprotease protein
MLVGGVTTLFTNANPLLPLDGYFALTDWLEIPNLRHRAFAHFQWWVKRTVFRLEVPEPAATARERRVFMIYGALALAYMVALFTFLISLALGWASRVMGGLGVVLGLIVIFALLRKRLAEWGRTLSLALRAQRQMMLTLRRRLAVGAGVIVIVLLLVPWTLTSPGTLVVRPVSTLTVSAADSGVVAQVFVTEGARVDAGAPLVRIVDRELDRQLLANGRAVDSLTLSESAARSAGMTGVASRLAAERESALAALAVLERRVGGLTLRAASAGTVATPRPEELVGRRVAPGDSLLAIAALDSVELRIALVGAGATRVRAGQIVHAISFADLGAPFTARLGEVSTSGVMGAGAGGVIEARVRRASGDAWRAGTIGEASVELERSNMLGALWWKARQLLRTDLWL